jgi:hypothetical protein
MIGHYERDGEIKIGGTALDSPSKREIVRQERMKPKARAPVKGSTRSAPTASVPPERLHWLHARRTPRGNPARADGDEHQQRRGPPQHGRIGRSEAE